MDETVSAEDFSGASLTPMQRFGADVKQVRLGRKLTQKHLAKAVGYSMSYVSQVEAGKLLPSEKFARGCDLAFGTNGLFAGLLHRLEEADHPAQFLPYLELEPKATQILDFSATAIMGLLQTEEYARAIFRAGHPREAEDVIQGKVAARIRRREVLEQRKPPCLWVVLHEACLRTHVGGNAVMAGQLDHLLTMVSRPGVDLQVIPYSAGAAAAHAVPFTLLTFLDSAPVLYAGDPQGGRIFRSASTVAAALHNYDRMRANALSIDDSLDFIRTLREEYRT
jgi:transcriptional regulator with XRE-family HTH domain